MFSTNSIPKGLFGNLTKTGCLALLATVLAPSMLLAADCPGIQSKHIDCDYEIARPVDPDAKMTQFPGIHPVKDGTLNLLLAIPGPITVFHNSQVEDLNHGRERDSLGFGAGNTVVPAIMYKAGAPELHLVEPNGRWIQFKLVAGSFVSSEYELGDLRIATAGKAGIQLKDPSTGETVNFYEQFYGQWQDKVMYLPSAMTNRIGARVLFKYNGAVPIEILDEPTGNKITLELNNKGNVEKITDADGIVWTYEYVKNLRDSYDLVRIKTVDQNYVPVLFEAQYDPQFSLVEKYWIAGDPRKMEIYYYNKHGLVSKVFTSFGQKLDHVTQYISSFDKLISISEGETEDRKPTAVFTQTDFDGPYPIRSGGADGYPGGSSAPIYTAIFTLADHGKVSTATDMWGQKTTFRYTAMEGNSCTASPVVTSPFPSCIANELGTTKFAYLANGAPTSIEQLSSAGQLIAKQAFTWDSTGLKLLSQTSRSAAGSVHTQRNFTYDAVGLPTKESYTLVTTATYTDPKHPDRPTSVIGPDGVAVNFTYSKGAATSVVSGGITQTVEPQISDQGFGVRTSVLGFSTNDWVAADGNEIVQSITSRSAGTDISRADYNYQGSRSFNPTQGNVTQAFTSQFTQNNLQGLGALREAGGTDATNPVPEQPVRNQKRRGSVKRGIPR